MPRLPTTLALALMGCAAATHAAPGDVLLGSPYLEYDRIDLAQAGLGGMGAPAAGGGGEGELELAGPIGAVQRALLYWHGVDLDWPEQGYSGGDADYDQPTILFNGQPVTGERLGSGGYNNHWGAGTAQSPGRYSAALYRADVTHLVNGAGSFPVSGLADGAGHSANGVSLVVFHDDGDPLNDVSVRHFELMDSNVDTLAGRNWHALLPVDYHGGRVELVLHVADGQSIQADGQYSAHVYPGLLPSESIKLDFGDPFLDGDPLWGGRSVPHAGAHRPSTGIGLWDIRRFDLTPAFQRPGVHAVYGYYQGGVDYLTLNVLQLVQSAPGSDPAITPSPLDFGDVPAGTVSETRLLRFTNLQNDPVTVISVSGGSTLIPRSGDDCAGAPLLPGESCTVQVHCAPTAARDYSAKVNIGWRDRYNENHGTGALLRCSGTTTAAHGRVRVDPPELWFGTLAPGGSLARGFTVTSAGSAAVTINELRRTGTHASSFRLGSDSCIGTTLEPGQRCSFQILLTAAPDRPLGVLQSTLEVIFSTTGTPHIPGLVALAGTVVPDERAIFKDGFEPR